jgi:hypothetical protein
MQTGTYITIEKNIEQNKYVIRLIQDNGSNHPGPEVMKKLDDRIEAYLNSEEDLVGVGLTLLEGIENPAVIHPMKLGNYEDVLIIGENVKYDADGDIDEQEDTAYYMFASNEGEDPVKLLLDQHFIELQSAQ